MKKVNGTKESRSGWNRLRIFLFHVFIVFLPCELSNVLKVYKLKKQDNQITKMTKFEVKYVVTYPNLSIQYEQDMAKFVIFLKYYHNVYERWYEW